MADNIGMDALEGAGTGATIGTEISPGWGTAIGAVAGALLGLAGGEIKKKRDEKNQLPLTDPYQIGMLNDLKRKQRSLETGTADQAQQDLIKQAGATAQQNIVKLSGGNIGVAVSQLNAAQRATGKNMNELFSEMSAESFKMDDLMESLVSKIANRKLEIQAYELGQNNVTQAQNKQNIMQNLMGAYAKNPDMFKNMFHKNTGSDTYSNPYGVNQPVTIGANNMPTGQDAGLAPVSNVYEYGNVAGDSNVSGVATE